MGTQAEFMALAEAHGIGVEYHPGGTSRATAFQGRERYAADFMLDAPHGKVFAANDCHCDGSLSHDLDHDGTRTDWRRAIAGLRAVIALGLKDCPDRPECDQCDAHEESI